MAVETRIERLDAALDSLLRRLAAPAGRSGDVRSDDFEEPLRLFDALDLLEERSPGAAASQLSLVADALAKLLPEDHARRSEIADRRREIAAAREEAAGEDEEIDAEPEEEEDAPSRSARSSSSQKPRRPRPDLLERYFAREKSIPAALARSFQQPVDGPWILAPLAPGDWRPVEPKHDKAVRALLASGLFHDLKAVTSARWCEPVFYPGGALYEFQTRGAADAGIACGFVSPVSVGRFDGTSPLIHQINAKMPVRLTEETAEAYLKFFCRAVHGEEGPFQLLETIDELPRQSELDPTTRETIEAAARPIEAKGCNEKGEFLFDAVVKYANALFTASFAVQPSGMVEMLDDDPIASDMAVAREYFEKGLRRLRLVEETEEPF